MNLGTYDITIDFSKLFVHNSTSIYFKEGDLNTARVRAKLTMQGKSIDITRCNVVVKIETMTGEKINDVATIVDAVNGIVEIDFKSNTLIEGTNFFELKIVKGESVKESPKLAYRVLDSIEDAGSIEGANEYPILIQLINDTNKAIEDANEALELANTMKTNLEEVIDNANSAISNATDATNNANTAATNATSKITEVDNAKNDMTTKVDESIDTMKSDVNQAKNDMKITVDEAIKFLKQEFNSLTAQQQEELEMLQARDGEANLNARLERDLYIGEKSLKQEVLDLGGLKEVQDMTYSTDKGYLACKETKAGTVKDLKIYGKSLKNEVLLNGIATEDRVKQNSLFVKGKGFYTIINNSNKRVILSILNKETNKWIRDFRFTNVGILELTESEQIGSVNGLFSDGWSSDDLESFNKTMILRGDHTQNPPSYFEGIASVGTNVDKIEVSSRKEDVNLFDGSTYIDGGLTNKDNTEFMIRNALYRSYVVKHVEPNSKYTVRVKNCGNRFGIATSYNYSETEEFILTNKKIYNSLDTTGQELELNITSGADDKYLFVYVANNGVFPSNIEIIVNKGDSAIFSEYIQDKKPLLYKDTDGTWKPITELRGLDTACDTVELHSDGKYYYHVRTKNTILQGADNMFVVDDTQPFTTMFAISGIFKPLEVKQLVGISDKYEFTNIYSIDKKGMYVIEGNGNIVIRDSKITLEEMKNKFRDNPVNFIVGLKEEKVFEVNPLFLESYENETMISFSGGPIAPYASWKITSYLPNFVMNLSKRVKRIEDDFYKYTVVQNRMQLATTYSSDRTTFRVDTSVFTAEKAKQEVDYDLFRLLRHNILVGPQNYNKEEMESIMDFYVSIGKINYDMWDELYLLIEEQHNPPVEEETPIM
nr:BppU family phage baseplate upper protein [[Eubacterium] tenue]